MGYIILYVITWSLAFDGHGQKCGWHVHSSKPTTFNYCVKDGKEEMALLKAQGITGFYECRKGFEPPIIPKNPPKNPNCPGSESINQ